MLVDTGDALESAVQNNSLGILSLLAEKSDPACAVEGFITAAGQDQVEKVNDLFPLIDEEPIEEALGQAASFGKVASLLCCCSSVIPMHTSAVS
ncbi:hypothetical protein JG687_00018609 [Phytophthora cactorum]|uniref:Uncharacterized protein n=1 Tax=Phytophthora cactorum TaxID=29920 RepID=A0A8T1TNF7_9STRA|nr:hypothetical protein JG687_00018609 [Phytophthora cactorum]